MNVIIPKYVQQITDVETYRQLPALIIDFNLLFRLVLFWVVCLQVCQPLTQAKSYSTIFFIGKDRRPHQRLLEFILVRHHEFGMTAWHHPFVVGETAID